MDSAKCLARPRPTREWQCGGIYLRLATDWLGLLPNQSPIEEAGFEVVCRVLEFLSPMV